jgi:hypothetical protein
MDLSVAGRMDFKTRFAGKMQKVSKDGGIDGSRDQEFAGANGLTTQ